MFGMGVPELILIFAVALIVFGPRRLPEIGRTLGKAMNEFKKATDDLKNTIERETQFEEIRQIKSSITEPFDSVRASLTNPLSMSGATVSRAEPSPAVAPDTPAVPSPTEALATETPSSPALVTANAAVALSGANTAVRQQQAASTEPEGESIHDILRSSEQNRTE